MFYDHGHGIFEYFISDCKEFGGVAGSTVIGKSGKIPAVWAVLVNGVQIHGHDYDDTHAESVTHTVPVVVPIVLAFGERNGLNGIQMLEALVLGLEFDCRAGRLTA